MKNTAALLQSYLMENKLDKPWKNENPLFTNNQHLPNQKNLVLKNLALNVVLLKKLSKK